MRIVFVNQYFPPDRAATGQLLGQLASDLSARFDVTVVCGSPTYAPDRRAAVASTVRIHRIPLLPFGRAFLPVRIANYLLFFLGAGLRTALLPPPDAVVCWTDPPVVGLLGAFLKWTTGCRFIQVYQDVYPDVARAARTMHGPASRRVLGWAASVIRRSADRSVAVGDDMRRRLIEAGGLAGRLSVIRNWQDGDELRPTPGRRFRREHGIDEAAFVVMHSGNLGFSQDLQPLLDAAALAREERDLWFVIAGDGARRKAVEEAVLTRGLTNVRLLPYQDGAVLAEALSAADLHYVSLRPEFLGLVVPSKLYGILAVGRPVLASVPAGCDVETIVREADCGFLSAPDPAALLARIREARANPQRLLEMRRNARAWFDQAGGRRAAAEAYARLLTSAV
jgi:glycosyltransferase involved in cell wall biosynthesis